eukprot:PhM_4_TR15285/c0_g1_i1/m.35783/K12840/RBM17, SPF45; splicing factor 45
MIEYDPTRPNNFDAQIVPLRCTDPMKINEDVLNIETGEEAWRRRIAITRKVADPTSPALREADLEEGKERAAARIARGTDKTNIGARLLSKMGFAGVGGLGKDGQGTATPLVHQGASSSSNNGNPSGGIGSKSAASISFGEEDEGVKRAFHRMFQGHPSPVLLVRNFITREMIAANDGSDAVARIELHKECTKIGSVKEVQVYEDGNGDEVRAFVVFDKITSAIRAMDVLSVRSYEQRKLKVSFYDESDYDDMVWDN